MDFRDLKHKRPDFPEDAGEFDEVEYTQLLLSWLKAKSGFHTPPELTWHLHQDLKWNDTDFLQI